MLCIFFPQLKIKIKQKPIDTLINHKYVSSACMSPLKVQCYILKYIQMSNKNLKPDIVKAQLLISHQHKHAAPGTSPASVRGNYIFRAAQAQNLFGYP